MIIPEPNRRPRSAAALEAAEAIVFGSAGAEAAAYELAPMSMELSPREHEVLVMVAQGHSNGEAATRLGLSVETVKSHMRRVLGKLGARNRCHAVALAYEHGLIEPGTVASPTRGPGQEPRASAS